MLFNVLFTIVLLTLIGAIVASLISFIVSFWSPAYAWWPTYQPWLRRGWMGTVLFGTILCVVLVGLAAYFYMPLPTIAEAGPSSSPSQPESADAPQVLDKCEWLKANFPQSTGAIQAYGAGLAGVQEERIATHVYRCDSTHTVFDGFIVLGPSEGYSGKFTLAVPEGGAVDTYAAAKCTGESQLLGSATDTVRCLSGSVTAERATYWPWLDEAPPVTTTSDSPSYSGCVDSTQLASEQGWTFTGSPDNYGGLVVHVTEKTKLPADWEAVTEGRKIQEADEYRGMLPGYWTIYPPYSCREELGYSK